MKYTRITLVSCALYAALFMSSLGLLAQASSKISNDIPDTNQKESVVLLSPFDVAADKDNSYGALNSNSVTRFNVELDKLPVTADIFNQAFMDDVGATTVEDMLQTYSSGSGSSSTDPSTNAGMQYNDHVAHTVIQLRGFDTTVIDIGGGFLADAESFKIVAATIRHAQLIHFNDHKIQFIAEPGRFLAAPTHTLYTTVIGKKPVYPAPLSIQEPAWRITIDESVYGSFSNIPFDHQKPILERLRPNKLAEKTRPTIVFGRTCDSGDCLGDNLPLVDVEVGDILKVRNMGAYTTVTASEFNGFPKPERIYELH